ncbi:NACHT domain-containing protein [Saccharothrix syringae]|uniref:AAA+ ATPase domain-containing protein n=1 Tax=Saccharothrix syringae TaxID=103733 RepID=A0A5Q0H9D9_SACSY|nr:AAA family ATPase [Saccharothrix syringae]QFZ22440.1 hypothetical protein EKG83_37945 [Saccharothrix syringae]
MDTRRLARASRLTALVTAGGVTGLVLVPIAVNTATGGSAPRVLGPYTTWLWPALALLSAVTAGLAAWEPLRALLLRGRPAHPAHRAAALERVERFVRDRLDGSLAGEVRRKVGVAPEVGPRLPARPRTALVVVGEPGAGKTTLLLELAGRLLEAARQDPLRPVPVVVDLGGWRPAEEFGEWLLRAVADRYRIAPRVVRRWLRDHGVAWLLDGLDELPEADRAECVDRVAALKLGPVVLCGAAGGAHRRLPRHEVVQVEPLRRNDVQDLITACEPRLDGLREALHKDPELWDEVRTPLAFGLLALGYRAGRAEYRGVVDTYLVESAARGSGRPERVVRALRFLARVAQRQRDLVARARLPHREVWLDFVGEAAVRRVFRRAAPAALAGGATALCFVVGVRLGVVPGAFAAVAAVLVPGGDFAVPGSRRGTRWAVAGFAAGAAGFGGVAALGAWLGGQVARWPAAVAFALVVLVALAVAYAGTRDRYWTVVCALAPAGVMVLTGPSAALLTGLGTGLAVGAVAGVLVGGLTAVWAGLGRPVAGSLRWLPLAGLAGTGLAALAGAEVHPAALGPATGLLVGLAVTPVANRPLDPVAELLARPLALEELPPRRRALLQSARDRLLLVEGFRFPHAAVRDHLAACDPAELAADVARRRADLTPSASGPTA